MTVRVRGAALCAAVCAVMLSVGLAAANDLILSPKTTLLIIHESSTPGQCISSVSEPCDSFALNVPFTTTKAAQVEAGQDLVSEASAILFGPAGMCADFPNHPPVFQISLFPGALQQLAGTKFGFSGITTGFDFFNNTNGTPVQPFVSVVLVAKGSGNVLHGGTYTATGSGDFQTLTSGPVDVALVPLENNDGDGNDLNCIEVKPVYRNEIF
jgi:hypothetical protein